jgi:divalent metal cation (Fe/Co/Zn/Cd) transporter
VIAERDLVRVNAEHEAFIETRAQEVDLPLRFTVVGHRLHAEADIVVEADLPVREAAMIAEKLRAEARHHLPALSSLRIEIKSVQTDVADRRQPAGTPA